MAQIRCVGYLTRRIPNPPRGWDFQLAAADIPTRHFLLHADRGTLVHRIERDTPGNRRWRLELLPDYGVALSWPRGDAHAVDTTDVTPRDVARAISARVAA
jgi:hypothetical protein